MEENNYNVYMHIFPNGKKYIGITRQKVEKRWSNGEGYKEQPLYQDILKYGWDNIEHIVLFSNISKSEAQELEIELIKKYNTIENGYNISKGGPYPIMIGEDNFKNKVPTAIIPLIINDLKQNKMSDREISKKYGLTDKIIADINHGYSHKIDWQTYPIRIKKGRQKLTEEEADGIKNDLLNSTLTFSEIAEKFNTTKSNISQINQGRNFRRDKDIYPIHMVYYKY